MKMHLAVQNVVHDLLQREQDALSEADIDELFEHHWEVHGPIDHGYADSYRRAARRLIEFLTEIRAGETPEPRESFEIDVDDARIVVQP